MAAPLLALLFFAPGFTVQVASTSSKAEAQRLVSALVGRDLAAHFLEASVGGKTVYRVRVGHFATREEAKAFGESLPEELRGSPWVAPEEEAPSPPATATPQPPGPGSTLALAQAAHGGNEGGFAELARAKSLLLRYRIKSLDPGTGEARFARHLYLRRGEDLRLEIMPLHEEDGAPALAVPASITVATGQKGWVAVGTAHPAPLPVATARSRIEALGPSGILRLPLSFGARGAAAAGVDGPLKDLGTRTLNGAPALRLDAAPAPKPYQEESLYLEPATHRLCAVRYLTDAGELLISFEDYRPVTPRLIVPHRRTVYRDGEAVSSVEIDEMALDVPLDDSLFR